MSSATITAIILIAIVAFMALVFLSIIKHLAENRVSETEERLHDCFDSYFWLQRHLKEQDTTVSKVAAHKLDKALDILLEVEQMMQNQPEEQNGEE